MTQTSIIGCAALAIGCLALFFAWQSSSVPVDQVSQAPTGRVPDATMLYLLGDVIGVVAGVALLDRGSERR